MNVPKCRAIATCLGVVLAPPAHAAPPSTPTRLTVMTYNVHDLPWPVARNRPAAMADIAARLRALRAVHRQPDVVALQEAFGDDAKAIGRAAGYRYSALGPAIGDVSTLKTSPRDRRFISAGRILDGEGMGKQLDSGLAIFSDYPIIAVRLMVYPVCAGFDCLANKGAVAATILDPRGGMVTVLNTHLNSGRASGVAKPRRYYAYGRQIAQVSAFAAMLEGMGAPLLMAGDFNVGHDQVRRRTFGTWLASARAAPSIAAIACRADAGCAPTVTRELAQSLARAKDWLMYRASANVSIRPIAFGAPFGRNRDGTMLSDHTGIAVSYLLEPFAMRDRRMAHKAAPRLVALSR